MKDLKIRMNSGQTELTLGDGNYRGPRMVLDVGHLDESKWCDCYLTPKRAERMRDWLTGWLAEQKKRKAKR